MNDLPLLFWFCTQNYWVRIPWFFETWSFGHVYEFVLRVLLRENTWTQFLLAVSVISCVNCEKSVPQSLYIWDDCPHRIMDRLCWHDWLVPIEYESTKMIPLGLYHQSLPRLFSMAAGSGALNAVPVFCELGSLSFGRMLRI